MSDASRGGEGSVEEGGSTAATMDTEEEEGTLEGNVTALDQKCEAYALKGQDALERHERNSSWLYSYQDTASYREGCRARCMSCQGGASLVHRVPSKFVHGSFTTVPGSGQDAFLYFFFALLLGCLFAANWRWVSPRLKAKLKVLLAIPHTIAVMMAGGVVYLIAYAFNLREFSNSFSWWLNMNPPELLFYAVLPILLFDAAMRINWFHFRRSFVPILIFAFAIVVLNTGLTAAFMQYGVVKLAGLLFTELNYWNWWHGLTFGAILGSTDPVAVVSAMQESSAPHALSTVIEGESLFNDASAYILFQSFLNNAMVDVPNVSVGHIIGNCLYNAAVGTLVGLISGYILVFIIKSLREQKTLETAFTVIFAYLSFYISQRTLMASGPVAVTVCGLFMSGSGLAAVSPRVRSHLLSFWDIITFIANTLIFFYSGSLLFAIFMFDSNAINEKDKESDNVHVWAAVAIGWPLIYITQFIFRGMWIALFYPFMHWLGHKEMTLGAAVFLNFSALRGGINLVMALMVAISSKVQPDGVRYAITVWVAGFVLLTQLINVPLIPLLIKTTKLVMASSIHVRMYEKAKRALHVFTLDAIRQLEKDPSLHSADMSKMVKVVETILELGSTSHESERYMKLRALSKKYHAEPGKDKLVDSQFPIAFSEGAIQTKKDMEGRLCWYFYEEGSPENTETPLTRNAITRRSYELSRDHTALPSADPLMQYKLMVSTVRAAGVNTLASQRVDEEVSLSTLKEEQSMHTFPSKTSANVPLHNQRMGPMDSNTTMKASDEGRLERINSGDDFYTLERFFSRFANQENQEAISDGATSKPHTPRTRTFLMNQSENIADEAMDQGHLRDKFIVGVKRHCRQQRARGRISPSELQWLEEMCDRASHNSSEPLGMWTFLESRLWVGRIERHYTIFNYCKRHPYLFKFLLPCLSWLSGRGMKLSCTIAFSFLDAIKSVGKHAWVRAFEWLHLEVLREIDMVQLFLSHLKLDDPDLVQAVQTYRATRSLGTMMVSFVETMEASGLIDDHEANQLVKPVEEGLSYHVQSFSYHSVLPKDILKGLSFCRELSQEQFHSYVLSKVREGLFKRGERIPNKFQGKRGMWIVFRGVLRTEFYGDPVDVEEKSKQVNRTKIHSLVGSGAVLKMRPVLTHTPTRHHNIFAYSSVVYLGFLSEKNINKIRAVCPKAERELFRCAAAQVLDKWLRVALESEENNMSITEGYHLDLPDQGISPHSSLNSGKSMEASLHQSAAGISVRSDALGDVEAPSPIEISPTIQGIGLEASVMQKLDRESLIRPLSSRALSSVDKPVQDSGMSLSRTSQKVLGEKAKLKDLAILLLNSLDFTDVVVLNVGDTIIQQSHIVLLGGLLEELVEPQNLNTSGLTNRRFSDFGVIQYCQERTLIAQERVYLVVFFPMLY